MASPASNRSVGTNGGESASSSSAPAAPARAAAEVIAVTSRDDFLLDLGESLGGQVSITPVESVSSAFELFSTSSRRTQLLVVDARDIADIRDDIEQAQYQLPNTTMLVFAQADAEKQVAGALKGSNIFAVLPIPIDRRKTAAVFEGALTEAAARRAATRAAASAEPPAIDISIDEQSPFEPASLANSGGDAPLQNRKVLIAAAVVLALLAGGGVYWYMGQESSDPVAASPSTPAQTAPDAQPGDATQTQGGVPLVVGKVDDLLEKARLAMRERRYTEPATDNALLYYRSALGVDPSNGEASDGIDRVANLLLARLEEATTAGRYDEATSALAALKAAIPSDPRLAPLELNLANMQVKKATSDQNFERAVALINKYRQSGVFSVEQANKLLAENTSKQDEVRVQGILNDFNEALREGRLFEPANDSAKEYLAQLSSVASPAVVQRARQNYLTALQRRGLEAAGTPSRAAEVTRVLDEMKAAGASASEINAFQRSVANQKKNAAAAEGDRLAGLAQQRVRDLRLTEPANDSANFYLTELRNIDPANAALAPVARELAIKLIERANAAALAGRFQQVDADLALARRWGADESEIQRVQALANSRKSTPTQRAVSAGGSAVPAGPAANQPQQAAPKLKRVRYAAPEYPPKALDERLSGYVTIDFVVSTSGEPTDLRVVDAKPADIFDRAALAAVKRWRYEPVIVNNVPTEVPNRTVIRFELPK